jgi:hypothetical protein
MHTARRAAAWAAWAEWTCNIRYCRRTLQVPVAVKQSGLRPALVYGAPGRRVVHSGVGCAVASLPQVPSAS